MTATTTVCQNNIKSILHKVTSLAELAEMDVKALGAVMGEVGARKLHAFLHKNTADFKAVRGSKYTRLWVACDDWRGGVRVLLWT